MNTIELFAGAGGLAMGVAKAGFSHRVVVEWDQHSCDTLRYNKLRGVEPVNEWDIRQTDVRLFDYSEFEDRIDLIAGGPPCQPFSLGGKHRGYQDARDMFPEAIRAVREVRPKAFLFENVKGLLRESFSKYFEYVLLHLSYPEIVHKNGEEWSRHLARLEKQHTVGHFKGLHYRVVFRLLNSADYGVPQRRERVILVGMRDDLGLEWSFPEGTHSEESLWWSKWESGDYWDKHRISRKRIPPRPSFLDRKIGKLIPPNERPWVTVRDALSGLPDLRDGKHNGLLNHVLQPGAKSYPGHTGSQLDEPAKTLKAGDHGVPGGENMMVLDDGTLRYFTVRESARLQTFPDDYGFRVSWTESMRQLGNAVPIQLAHSISETLREKLSKASRA